MQLPIVWWDKFCLTLHRELAFVYKAEILYALLWFLKGPAAPKYHAPSNQFGKVSASSSVKTPGGSQAKVVPIASLNPYQSK